MDRCDTEPLWFLFAGCGRPFMCANINSSLAIKTLKSERRRVIGSSLELRSGNYAFATMTELLESWPKSKVTVAENGAFIHVEPSDVMELVA